MRILVTGGTGYIGSNTAVALLNAGYEVIILDNLSNSRREVLATIEQLCGRKPVFYNIDLLKENALSSVFAKNRIAAVIHFAGLKAVGESVSQPAAYYRNNVTGTLNLIHAMQQHGVSCMIFSSSATVYGMHNIPPFKEDMPLSAANPYGWTKLMVEQILRDLCAADPAWSACILRYFNPIGAHMQGFLGDSPRYPNNLMPYITDVALGKREALGIFGDDYPTIDGTGVRDYIHVSDLARGHVAALDAALSRRGAAVYNLGTGKGASVLQVVKAFERVNGLSIPTKILPRRPGDMAVSYADCALANQELQWTATHTLEDMCKSAWLFAKRHRETPHA